MDLTLNETKTRVVDPTQEMFSFLGFEIGLWKGRRTGKWYPHVQPSKASLQTIKGRITGLTARNRTLIPLEELVKEVNETVRGWVDYFHFKNCSVRMLQVRTHLEDRLQTHLRRRYKIRNRGSGYVRSPRRVLYERYGLFKVPATAGWKRVHALR
jgi:RNA-directed DNA polymerase